MIKTINYSGVTHSPHNSTSPDGELSLCLNLVNDNGTLTSLEEPTPLVTLPDGLQALYTHETSTFRHLIAYDSDAQSLIWVDLNTLAFGNMDWGDDTYWGTILSSLNTAPTINHIGNTLIILHKDKPMGYAVWKDNNYKHLGFKPPFINMKAGLLSSTNFVGSITLPSGTDTFYPKSVANQTDGGYTVEFSEELADKISASVLAGVNEHIATYTKKGKFIFPFLLRYALRLYDGSLVQQSFPILLIPNSYLIASFNGNPVSTNNFSLYTIDYSKITDCNITPFLADLGTHILDVPAELSNWKDLVQSLDIFISAPIYTYDQGKKVTKLSYSHDSGVNKNFGVFEDFAGERSFTHNSIFQIPRKDDDVLQDAVESCSLFYKIHSIPFDNIKKQGDFTKIAIDGEKLLTITSQEVMTDEYNSHQSIHADNSFVYNSRLNLSGISQEILTDVYGSVQISGTASANKRFDLYTTLSSDGAAYTLRHPREYVNDIYGTDGNPYSAFPRYIYYPYTNVSNTIFHSITDNIAYFMPMKEHSGLNGSVYFRGFGDVMPVAHNISDIPSVADKILIPQPNKIYTSDVSNPFTFKPSDTNTIGTGRILALCASTQAISQGQFGAFPLYAFTTEGIWALSVNDSGGWSSIQPVSRDVIAEGTQPISIDKAVVFFSEQGLMILEGGVTTCISKNLTSDSIHPIPANLPTGIPTDELSAALTFPKSASLGYDYMHSRIYAFGKYITWVYSLRKGTWSHTYAGNAGDYALNEYPNMIMVRCGEGKPQELLELTPASGYYSFGEFLTRPVKFGSYSLRTIRSLVTRGLAEDVYATQVLYASFDGESFAPIAGDDSKRISRISGSGYQMHSLFCSVRNFDSHFAITCTDCDVIPKHTNKLR